MSGAVTGWARLRRALSALLPHAVVVPLFTLLALMGSGILALLGAGALLSAFGESMLALTHAGGGGHGYGVLAGLAVWAFMLVGGASAAAGFVLLSTLCAASAGMIASGLIDLARLPRELSRSDTFYPKRWGAWAAALSLVGVAGTAALAGAGVERVTTLDAVMLLLLAGPLCALALLAGLVVRSVARRRLREEDRRD